MLLLDLDRFKEVNDTLGHHAGDAPLQQIAERLQEAVLPTELVARLGGDEFAVLLPGSDATRATRTALRLQHILQAPVVLDGHPTAVDVSIGIAVAPEHGQDADTLLRCADVAMYQANAAGTGVAVYSAAIDQNRPDRLALLGELRRAVERDEMLLHYQPKLDLRDGSLAGVEALVRWRHPLRGLLAPGRVHSARRTDRVDLSAQPLGARYRVETATDLARHGPGNTSCREPVKACAARSRTARHCRAIAGTLRYGPQRIAPGDHRE